MTKHTPGPWVQIRCNERDGAGVATLEPAPETMETPNYWRIASTNTRRDEWHANARLIAAAPDMLQTLRDVLPHLEGGLIGAQVLSTIYKATEAP